MSAPSRTSAQPTLPGTSSATSSPGSASGPTPCDAPGGPTRTRSGRAPAPASRSARPARKQDFRTSVIFGPPGHGSSPSEDLARSVANRLRTVTASRGSTLFKLTWKRVAMPSGRWCYLLRASDRPTRDTARSSWPTPNAIPTTRGGLQRNPEAALRRRAGGHMLNLDDAAALASWPTPCQQDGPNGGPSQGADRLPAAAALVAWATPTTRDHKDGENALRQVPVNALLGRQALLASWQTPTVV